MPIESWLFAIAVGQGGWELSARLGGWGGQRPPHTDNVKFIFKKNIRFLKDTEKLFGIQGSYDKVIIINVIRNEKTNFFKLRQNWEEP